MSDWASGEGYTTLEDVFASRDFGRHPQAAAPAAAARPAPRPGRAHLFTNRAIAVISASAAGLSVVATLVVNGGGPALSPVISAQHAPSNVPDFLTPVPQGSVGQGAAGGSAGAGATGSSGGAPTAPGAAGGGSSVGAGTTSGGSGGTTVVALGPTPASASLASFTVSHPTQKTPPSPPPPSSTTTTTTQPPPISAGGNVSGGRDNGGGNGGQNNGNGNAKGVANNGGGTVFVSAVSSQGRGRGNG